MRTRTDSSRRGSALVSVVVVMVALAGMSAALITTSLFRQGNARAMHEQQRAYQVAMTGLDLALFELQEGLDLGTDDVGNATGEIDGGTYTVTVTPAYAGPGEYTLRAAGQFGPTSMGVELVIASGIGYPWGMFARDDLSMSGSFSSDSYDASAGTYASQFFGDHAGDQGHVASNGDIVAGGGMIHGDATPGPGFQVLGDPTNVTGSIVPATTPQVVDPYVYAPAIASSGSYSGTGTITAGTYRYDDLTLSGSSTLTIDGSVTLFVDDKFTSSGGSTIVLTAGSQLVVHHGANDFTVSGGGIVNPSLMPKDVQIFSASTKKFTLSGGSDFFGLAYASEAEFVSSGGSQLYGVVVARTASLSGDGWLHFDTSLQSGDGGAFRVRSARKISHLDV